MTPPEPHAGVPSKRMAAKAVAASTAAPLEAVTAGLCPAGEDWAVDEQLRHIARVLGVEPPAEIPPEGPRVDRPHRPAVSSSSSLAPACPEPVAKPAGKRELFDWARQAQAWQARRVFPALCWLAVLAGTMAGTCGVVLLGWSAVAGRPELRPVGMPIALAGAAALAVGLYFQIDRFRKRATEPSGGSPEAVPVDPAGPAIRIDAGTTSPTVSDHPAEQLAVPASVP